MDSLEDTMKRTNRYRELCELQGECKLLSIDDSIALTNHIYNYDIVEAAILLLKLLIIEENKDAK